MTPTEGLDKIMADSDKVIRNEALKLFADLKKTSPTDTENFKRSWGIKTLKRSPLSIRISNSAEYADVLARGRRKLPNFNGVIQWYGSPKWRNGLSPMLKKTNRNIEKRLGGLFA